MNLSDFLSEVVSIFLSIFSGLDSGYIIIHKFIPFVLFIELPFYFLVIIGIIRFITRRSFQQPHKRPFYPKVSSLLICYSEGENVAKGVISLAEQIYPGLIEIIAVVDGAKQNADTYNALKRLEERVKKYPNRRLIVLPKWKRGGRVSSINSGNKRASGKIVMVLDGDTSFDNDMVAKATRHFRDKNVVAVSGALRARNVFKNIVTRLQAIEYLISIQASRIGLGEYNAVNNVSGAFGVFRKDFVDKVYGWDAGTAEDLDLTFRIKQYFGRYKNLKIVFESRAMGHTDVPETLFQFFDQRLRWDGDLYWLYFRKHNMGFSPFLLGWKNFIFTIWYGLLFQIVMPFLILGYTIYSFAVFPLPQVGAVLMLIYLFYLGITLVFYGLTVFFISERKWSDLRLAWLIPLFPIFLMAIRIWAAVATLAEIFLHSNKSSNMAPYWVLRKGKF